MASVKVKAAAAHGVFAAPPSKSAAHRALIAAALSGDSRIRGISQSEDMLATLACLTALGAVYDRQGDTVIFCAERGAGAAVADCGESGSTLRFFVPIFAAMGKSVTFVGRGRMPQRPMTVYEECLPSHGVTLSRPSIDGGIVTVSGKLRGGRYEVAGDVSSQFITGLLFALPLCEEDSEIVLTTPLQSGDYVTLTIDILQQAGIAVEKTADGFAVKGGQHYRLQEHTVEGDWSQAAFLLAAGALGGDITVTNLRLDSKQGDKRIVSLLADMGADIVCEGETVRCRKSALAGIEADVADVPDLVPILSVTAAAAQGSSRWHNAARLRMKESDRLSSTAGLLRALGGCCEEQADALVIDGVPLHGGTVCGENDHRIVMSGAVASLLIDGEVILTDAHSVAKSWPDFFETYKAWGGTVNEF